MAQWQQGNAQWASSGQSWQGGGAAAGGTAAPWQGGCGGQTWQSGSGQAAPANSWQGSAQPGCGNSWTPAASQQAGAGGWNQGGQQGQSDQQSWQQGASSAGGATGSWTAASGANAPWATPQFPKTLQVKGCTHGTIGKIVRGTFLLEGENHTKPTYKRTEKVQGLDVMMYFWDERDGIAQAGWWFGPKVGGEQVWAFNPNLKTKTPPREGWQVPYGGPVDSEFIVSEPPAASSQPPPPPAPWQQAASPQQAWSNQGQQQWSNQNQQGQQAWGNQGKGGQQAWGQQKGGWGKGGQQAWQNSPQQEEMQRRKEEAQRKRLEDERLRQEAAAKRKAEEEAKKKETRAVFAIRRCIQKVKTSTLEAFEDSKQELDAEIAKELENCGSQKEIIETEVKTGLEQAAERMEQIREVRLKEEEKKAELERQRQEKHEKAKQLLEELKGQVEAAEAEHDHLKEVIKGLDFAQDEEVTAQEIDDVFRRVTEAEEAAKQAAKACSDLITEQGPAMKDPAVDAETKQGSAKMLQRISECHKSIESTSAGAKGKKDAAYRKSAAQERTKAIENEFRKFDKDKDKALSTKEVAAFAKEKYGMKLEKDTLDWIWKSIVDDDGSKGVRLDRFVRLRSIIGVIRELGRDEKRKAARLKKEAVIGGLKDTLKANVISAEKFATAAKEAIAGIEADVNTWRYKARVLAVDDMVSVVDRCDEKINEVQAKFSKARVELDALSDGVDSTYEEDLRSYLAELSKPIELNMSKADVRIARIEMLSRRFRTQATARETETIENLRSNAIKVVAHNQSLKEVDSDAFFDEIADGRAGIDKKAWLRFFAEADKDITEVKPLMVDLKKGQEAAEDAEKENQKKQQDQDKSENGAAEEKIEVKAAVAAKEMVEGQRHDRIELSEDELSRVFEHLDEDGSGQLSKDTFVSMTTRFMRVVKETAMTSSMGIVGGRSLRKLEPQEVVKVLKGPVKDDSMKVSRIFCKAMKDSKEGWVSIAGNQGTVFLQESGNYFKVVRPSFLTDGFDEVSEEDDRMLPIGTVIEAREFPKEHEEFGIFRLFGRVRGRSAKDGMGWVTTTDPEGIVFVKPM